tara:strand:- start:2816 stop:3799 length:984 start_codon:yes stop_codon:yes gene_type:complete
METKKAAIANRPKIWSISRRSLMNQCPRAWILKYGFARRQGGFNRHLRNISDWSSPWRLMQRALRGVIIERLSTQSKGRSWIERDLAGKIRNRIIGGLTRQKSVIEVIETRIGEVSSLRRKIESRRIDRLVEIACYRFHAAMKSKPIKDILDGRIKEWYLFSRLDKTKLDKFELHISPDLVWYSGSTCHLMRFTIQGVANPGDDRRLENMAMVMWACQQNGLPANPERYIVENLYWNNGQWKMWRERCTHRHLEDAIHMIKSDMNAMIDLHYRLGLSCDLSQIPLAKSKRTCRNCGHKDTCPGGQDLVRARLEQSALEMAKASKKRN